MKISNKELKTLFENKVDNQLIDNLIGYYFEGDFTPALITEKQIVFYSTGRDKFYITDYLWEKDGLVCEGLKKLSFGKKEENEEILEGVAKNIFEIDEKRESFNKSLKKISKLIESDDVIINEDIWTNQMKGEANRKSSIILRKSGERGTPNNNSANFTEFSNRMKSMSSKIKNQLKSGIKASGKEVSNFYDYLDMSKVKFKYADGSNLYKQMKVTFPRSTQWIAENTDLLKKNGMTYGKGLNDYGDVVSDSSKLLKKMKYIEDTEKLPQAKHVSNLLGTMKGKGNAKKNWKDKGFKSTIQEMHENNVEVEDVIKKYDILNLFTEKELTSLMEKTLLAIYDDAKMIQEAKKIGKALYEYMSENTRQNYLEEILECEILDADGLINENDIGQFVKAHRNPDDLSIVMVKNLAETIEDYLGRYRESDMDVEDMKIIETTLFKLNDIWARQRITENDKRFLKTVMEGLEDIENNDKKMADAIVDAKDKNRDGIESAEINILKQNIELGKENFKS